MTEASTFESSKHSVLIIDDEPDLCELIEFQLQKDGFRTATLSNPLEAIGTARDFCPDLIILDVMMPELNGLRLCSMLKVDSKMHNQNTQKRFSSLALSFCVYSDFLFHFGCSMIHHLRH